VTVVPDGFVWQGETYTSLSVIAKTITGTAWNGPRFFGLRMREAAESTEAAQSPPQQPSAKPSRRNRSSVRASRFASP